MRALGVGLAIDDFGNGYSSLAYLKVFPVDFIEIDRSIVAGLDADRSNLAVVLSTVALVNALGLRVAEGVEEAEKLRETGCDIGQGYYWWGPNAPPRRHRSCASEPDPPSASRSHASLVESSVWKVSAKRTCRRASTFWCSTAPGV